jgi:hypothetical protein
MIILLQITAACLICGHHSTPKKRVNASKKLSCQQQQWRFLFLSLQINIPWELKERSRFVLSIKISIEERPPHQPRLPAESQVISLKLWRMDRTDTLLLVGMSIFCQIISNATHTVHHLAMAAQRVEKWKNVSR